MRALVFRSAYSASRNARASAAFAASIETHCAVGTETLMLQVRSAHPPMPHRNVFSKHPGVPVGLFSDSAPTHLRCAGVPLGLFGKPKRSSSSRFAAFGGRGELRSPFSAPKCPFGTFRCSAWLIFRFRTDPPSVRRCSAGLIGSAKRSGSSRFAAFGGRGKLRSPLHPSLPPPAHCGTVGLFVMSATTD